MIPRVVHVVDFKTAPQAAFPEEIQASKRSQEKQFQGWKKMVWTEKDFLEFTREQAWYVRNAEALLELGAWAIISDIIRLFALFSYGGIYVDWDLEFQRTIPSEMFEGPSVLGFEPYTYAGKGTAQVGAQFLLGRQDQTLWRRCYTILAKSLWTKAFCILPTILTRVLEDEYGLPTPRSKHNYYYLRQTTAQTNGQKVAQTTAQANEQTTAQANERCSWRDSVRVYPQEYFYPIEGLAPSTTTDAFPDAAKITVYSVARHWEHSQKVTRILRKGKVLQEGKTAHKSWPQYLSQCKQEYRQNMRQDAHSSSPR